MSTAAGLMRTPLSPLVPLHLPARRRHLRAPLQLVPERIVLPRHGGALHRLAGELLDAAQEVVLLRRGEAGSSPTRFHARGAPDTMHVVLRNVGQVEIHHVPDLGHVDALAAMSVATSTRCSPERNPSS